MIETYFEHIGTDKTVFTKSGVKSHERNPYDTLIELHKTVGNSNKFLLEHFVNSVRFPTDPIEYNPDDEYYYDEDHCAWIMKHEDDYHIFV
jgi:hypothetical protein